jgi:hypothetical protein
VAIEDDDKKTRKMDAEQFRALLATENQSEPTVRVPLDAVQALAAKSASVGTPPPRKDMSTGELMKQVDDAFVEFGPGTAPQVPRAAPRFIAMPAPPRTSSSLFVFVSVLCVSLALALLLLR